MPGMLQQPPAYVVAVGAAVERELAARPARGTAPTRARPRARGIGSVLGVEPRPASRADGKRWVSAARRARPAARRSCSVSRPAAVRAAGDRHLLAEHGADGELVAVDVAGHPQPGCGAHQRRRAPGRRRTRRRSRPGRSRRRRGGGPARPRPRGRAGRSSRNVAGTNAVDPRSGGRRARARPCRGRAAVGGCARTSCRVRQSRRPATAWCARKSSRARPANGVRTASRSWRCPPPLLRRPRGGRAAASGVAA